MKTVGIIGGLGPETTSKFYLELIVSCQKINKVNRPPILIYSVPLPYDIEEDVIIKSKGEERCLPFIFEAAKKLEKAGADFLVMPCNSLHAFIEDIRGAVKIPVLSIVEETTKFLKKENISLIGVISTGITLNKKLYENSLIANGIKQITPDDFQQAKIGKMIYNLVSNKHNNKDREELIKIINDFENSGNYFLNITHPSKKEIYDVYVKKEKVFQNKAAAGTFIKNLPKYPVLARKKYILLTPFSKEKNKPDLIMFLANPAQAGRILGLSVYKKMSYPLIMPALSTCASIYAPIESNKIHINFIDYYDRYYQGKQRKQLFWQESDLIISMPFGIFKDIMRYIPLSAHGSYKPKIKPQKVARL